jgi:uncharacterized protein (DUF488 family)
VEIYTIGFTKKPAASFFDTLKNHNIRCLIDVRVNNASQLAGFSKQDDLAYFLREIVGADYLHEPQLAPTEELLKRYRDKSIGWPEYEKSFLALLKEREIQNKLARSLFDKPTALLCSEPTQDQCHRRVVVEYLDANWGNVRAIPL